MEGDHAHPPAPVHRCLLSRCPGYGPRGRPQAAKCCPYWFCRWQIAWLPASGSLCPHSHGHTPPLQHLSHALGTDRRAPDLPLCGSPGVTEAGLQQRPRCLDTSWPRLVLVHGPPLWAWGALGLSKCDEILDRERDRGRWGAKGEGWGWGLEGQVCNLRWGWVKPRPWMLGIVCGPWNGQGELKWTTHGGAHHLDISPIWRGRKRRAEYR